MAVIRRSAIDQNIIVLTDDELINLYDILVKSPDTSTYFLNEIRSIFIPDRVPPPSSKE